MRNRQDLDQLLCSAVSDLDLHSLLMPALNTSGKCRSLMLTMLGNNFRDNSLKQFYFSQKIG